MIEGDGEPQGIQVLFAKVGALDGGDGPFTKTCLRSKLNGKNYRALDSIFCAAERYFAYIEAVVTPIEFNGFSSAKDIHGHVVKFGS